MVLRRLRERRGLSQAALAREISMAPNMISRLEAGERNQPTFGTVAKIASALGASLDNIAAACGYGAAGANPSEPQLERVFADLQKAREQLHSVDEDLSKAAAALRPRAKTKRKR
jgi:transcriptional regulator with XRE-family HTH domain